MMKRLKIIKRNMKKLKIELSKILIQSSVTKV